MSSQAQVGKEFLFAAKPFHASARFAGVECPRGERVGNPHVKGQTALQFDLPVKQMHRLGNGESQVRKDVFDFGFQSRLYAGADVGGFAHAPNVALSGLHSKRLLT